MTVFRVHVAHISHQDLDDSHKRLVVEDKVPEGIEDPDCPQSVLDRELFIMSEPLNLFEDLGRVDAVWNNARWVVYSVESYAYPTRLYSVKVEKVCDLSSEEIAGMLGYERS